MPKYLDLFTPPHVEEIIQQGRRQDYSLLEETTIPEHEQKEADFKCIEGSEYARNLQQYRQMLGTTIPAGEAMCDFVDYAEKFGKDLMLVDAGCGAGAALRDLRKEFPEARLSGYDSRNVLLNKIVSQAHQEPLEVGDLFKNHGIDFTQGVHSQIHRMFPDGYHILVCVGPFFETPLTPEMQIYQPTIMQLMYGGLCAQGVAQILVKQDAGAFHYLCESLRSKGIPFRFDLAHPELFQHNPDNGQSDVIVGTITLGPKLSQPRNKVEVPEDFFQQFSKRIDELMP